MTNKVNEVFEVMQGVLNFIVFQRKRMIAENNND